MLSLREIKKSTIKNQRVSLKKETTSEIKGLLAECQRELLKLLKPKTGECNNEEDETLLENETRSVYNPTKSVRIGNAPNNDPNHSRGNIYFHHAFKSG